MYPWGILGRFGRLAVAAGIAMVCPSGGSASQQEWGLSDPGYRSAQDASRKVPEFAFVTDGVTDLIGLPRLRDVTVPDQTLEVRVWTGFGITIPHQFVRIVSGPSGVSTEVVMWWEAREQDGSVPGYMAYWQRGAGRYGCIATHTGDVWRSHQPDGTVVEERGWDHACLMDYEQDERDWARVFEEVKEAGILDLPATEDLPPSDLMVLDGISLQVEILDGARFHTYMYSNPDYQPWPEAEIAHRLLQLVMELYASPR